jgi:two-component system response regulator CpxR
VIVDYLMTTARLLMIDDDTELVELVSEYLRREGFDVDTVHDGESGVSKALAGNYDLIVLDVMLPGIGGFEVLRRIRVSSAVPVVMLTARGDELDRVLGLETGADDYLAKPFSSRELVARIRAVLRRGETKAAPVPSSGVLKVGNVEIEGAARAVRKGGQIIDLTAAEFDLLDLLMHAAGEVVSREDIARKVLDRPLLPLDRSIDVHVSNLRKKLGSAPDGSEYIKTVRSVGYIFARPVGG